MFIRWPLLLSAMLVWGDVVRISGREFYCVKGEVALATQNAELRLGMTRGTFEKVYFNEGGGLGFDLDNTDKKLTFSWRSIVDSADDVMFFGCPLDGTRSFDTIFVGKQDVEYAHHVFRQFASEYKGDSRASAQLYASYQKRLRLSWENKYNMLKAANAGIYDKETFASNDAQKFRKVFNKHCMWAFAFCMTQYQDYSKPILLPIDFLAFQNIAKQVFGKQWRLLASLRNTNQKKDSIQMFAFKERQVFCQLLALQRCSNYRELNYWALINSVAYYG